MTATRSVRVTGVPAWVPAPRLLGPAFTADGDAWRAELPVAEAADLDARLRNLAIGGTSIAVAVAPPLPRAAVRAARTDDARRRRDTTPGFTRPGTRLDEEGRWSLTPEALALAIGRAAAGKRVLDATCGCGGNAIGFARAGCSVVAVDTSAERLALARHNAGIYGVADRIAFRRGSAEQLAPAIEADLVFVDPPWGTDWNRARTGLAELPALAAILAAVGDRAVWVKAPPSFDPAELPGATPEAWFGSAPGDRQRVKFLLLRRSAG